MATKYVDYILQAQIIKAIAMDVPLRQINKELNLSLPTLYKYKHKFAKEIEESRKAIAEKVSEIGDRVIATKYLKIADLCTHLLDKSLQKYKDENKEFKPGELTQISMIGAIAIDKNRVIENKPTNITKNPVIFNFRLATDNTPNTQATITISQDQIKEHITETIEAISKAKDNDDINNLSNSKFTIKHKKPVLSIKTTYHDDRGQVNGVL